MNEALICAKAFGNIQTVISRVVWHVDEERAIRIRKVGCDVLPPSVLRGYTPQQSRLTPFRRNLSVQFIHQTA
jgi:hypothetical protein